MRKLYGGMRSSDGGGTRIRFDGDRMKCCPKCMSVYEEYYHSGKKAMVCQPLPEIPTFKKERAVCHKCDESREEMLEVAV